MAFNSLRTPETDTQTAARLADRTLDCISQLLAAATGSSREDRQRFVNTSKPTAVKLVTKALTLHDAIQGEYVLTDYQVFLPEISKPAAPDRVKVDDTTSGKMARGTTWPAITMNAPGARVLLPTSLGLYAKRIAGNKMEECLQSSKVLLFVP